MKHCVVPESWRPCFVLRRFNQLTDAARLVLGCAAIGQRGSMNRKWTARPMRFSKLAILMAVSCAGATSVACSPFDEGTTPDSGPPANPPLDAITPDEATEGDDATSDADTTPVED